MHKPQQYTFILGHMRSYSTLLSHLLGTHPQISGYCELHQPYLTQNDFTKMRQKINHMYDKKVNSKFLLDKVLHNKYQIHKSVLTSPQVSLIFLLRKPEETMKSIRKMGDHFNDKGSLWFREPDAVLDYYKKRLQQLVLYAQYTKNPILFIEAESIIKDSTKVLTSIQSFLGLSETIKSEYDSFKLTGKPWYGDSTPEINSGKIITTQKVKNKIILSDDIIQQGQASYNACKAQLLSISSMS